MNPQPTMNPPSRPGWWKRNWKWFVPVSLVCVLLLGGAVIAMIVTMVMSSVKSSVPYTRALAQAKADPTLIAEMGSPIEAGWFVRGTIETRNQSGYANLMIPIYGPNKSGTLHVIAQKSNLVVFGTQDWDILLLEAKIDGRSEPIAIDSQSNKPPAVAEIEPDSPGSQLPPVRREMEVAPANPGAPGVRSGVIGGVPNADEPPPPAPAPSKITAPISGGVLNGRAIRLPHPEYPAIAKAAKVSGAVIVQVLVDENGNVVSAHAVSGPPLLKAAAESAARGARFTPTKLSGQAVKVSGVVTYNFVAQ